MDSSSQKTLRAMKRPARRALIRGAMILLFISVLVWTMFPDTDSSVRNALQPVVSWLSGVGDGTDEQSTQFTGSGRDIEEKSQVLESDAVSEQSTLTQHTPVSDLTNDPVPTAADSAEIPINVRSGNTIERSLPSTPNSASNELASNEEPSKEFDDDVVISGWVLNQDGLPVADMSVNARAYRLFDEMEPGPDEQSTITGQDGFYILPLTAEGEYEIRTAETDIYLSARILVRSGVASADITVTKKQDFLVYGLVQNVQGEALAGVSVQPLGTTKSTKTDEFGAYAVAVNRQRSGQMPSIRFAAEGYRKQQVSLRKAQWQSETEAQLDVSLEPVATSAMVSGIVSGPEGEAVADARVSLSSSGARQYYQVSSGGDGSFTIPQVEVSADYRLWVRAKESYRDYVEPDIGITEAGRDFTIQLERLDSGTISGLLLDSAGKPVPNFNLWLRSVEASARLPLMVASDANGAFSASAAPAGQLKFETRSAPSLAVTGLELKAGDNAFVHLVLDWGELQLLGRIVDATGSLSAKPEVTLTWSHQDGELQSQSFRRTTADADGYFLFTNLGPGVHRINVRAEGYRDEQLAVDVSPDVQEVQLTLIQK